MIKNLLKTTVAVLGLAVSSVALSFPEGSPKFFESFTEGSKAAAASSKPRVVVYSSTWCGPCQEMKSKVYPTAEVKPFHSKYEWIYVDIDKPENEKLVLENQVDSIPRIDILNASGEVVAKQVGEVSARNFSEYLLKGLAKTKE